MPAGLFRFGPFRLDSGRGQLMRGSDPVRLRPKTFELLRFFLANPGRLLEKNAILDAVWPDVHVTDAALKVVVAELREALGDRSDRPRFIETAHRRGYRFLAAVRADEGDEPDGPRLAWRPVSTGETTGLPRPVGRDRELATLEAWLERTMEGTGGVAFVAGEPGIGKTALVAEFLERAALRGAWVSGGQCQESVGTVEAYHPFLEALSHLARGPARGRVGEVLRRAAPTWLAQLPWLLEPRDRRELQREILGATRSRMMRELLEALELLSSDAPLVLALEDLHWSDGSTVDSIRFLLGRLRPMRVLVIGTFRPVDLIVGQHPLRDLRRELIAHRTWEELVLDSLPLEAVEAWLAARFPRSDFPATLSARLHARTDGNPLFVANVLEDLTARGTIREVEAGWKVAKPLDEIERAIPVGVREMIGRQVERLTPREREVLEAASAIGTDFTPAAVHAATGGTREEIEETCAALAEREQFLRPAENGGFTFAHGFYAGALYDRVSPTRRIRFHRAIGLALAEEKALERAATIAHHLELGADWSGAVRYGLDAAELARRRFANLEAEESLSRVLALAGRLPEHERDDARFEVAQSRGRIRRAAGEMSAAAAEFDAAVRVARDCGDRSREVAALLDLASALVSVDRPRCAAVLDEIGVRAAELDSGPERDSALGLAAGWDLDLRGWRPEIAAAIVRGGEAGDALGDPAARSLHLCWRASLGLYTADYRAAAEAARRGMALAEEAGDAYALLNCRAFAAWALFSLGAWREMLDVLDEGLAFARRNEDAISESTLELLSAVLHAEVFDYAGAQEIARHALEKSRAAGFVYGGSLGSFLLAIADFGLGRYREGFERIEELVREEESSLLETTVRMPLHFVRAAFWRGVGNLEAARRDGERVVELAAPSGEWSWVALGQTSLADTAVAAGDAERRDAALAAALAATERAEVPLAAWRVEATAAKIHAACGRSRLAERHRRRCRQLLNGLADELVDAPELRRSLLEAPAVAEIFVAGPAAGRRGRTRRS